MSDQQQPNVDVQQQLAAMLAQLQAQAGAQPETAGSGWQRQIVPPAQAMVQSVSIPINISTPGGKLRVYLGFHGSAADSPEKLMALIESLHNAGMPLDLWKGDSWGKGGGGWRR